MITAFLSLGSNIGDKELNIKKAVEELQTTNGIEITLVSSYYETLPEGGSEDVPKYLNAVTEILTTLSPRELLEKTQEIEKILGRKNKKDYSPRTIDIDIALYGNELIVQEELTIPHPLMHERLFVLEPLNEIAPETLHPVIGKTVQELFFELKYGYGNYN